LLNTPNVFLADVDDPYFDIYNKDTSLRSPILLKEKLKQLLSYLDISINVKIFKITLNKTKTTTITSVIQIEGVHALSLEFM
jgi:hypothetical protein